MPAQAQSTTTSPGRRAAFQFFHEHAGWATPPGKAACALSLARAEELLRRRLDEGNARVVWEDDDVSEFVSEEDAATLEGPFVCAVEIHGETVAACGGITLDARGAYGRYGTRDDGSQGWSADPYARVMEAELASEAADALAAPVSSRGGLAAILGNV